VSHDSASSQPEPVDWAAVRGSAEYENLRTARRRFLIPASAIYLIVYFGFLVLALNAPALFGRSLHAGLNVGFLAMTVMFVLVWLGVLLHNSIARRRWDPRIDRVRASATAGGPAAEPDRKVAP
jgi:uncharacterized membrane protein (DUF485 family)